MQAYRNLSGGSGVEAFESRPRSIAVRFVEGREYVYTWRSAGREHIEAMKRLAEAGRGLSSYISQHVSDLYARRR